MRFTVIGSGGCVALPKPLCKCKICKEARVKGKPYSRFGCSLFLEEDWGKSYDDYLKLENEYEGIAFAYDGMTLEI